MAESHVAIDGTVTTLPGVMTGANFYVYNLPDIPGVVAANNFISFFNPVGSGKTITVYRATIIPWASAGNSVDVSMRVFRISGTAPSGGTQVAAANIQKFTSSSTNSVADIRKANPTVGTVATEPVFSVPPAVSSAGVGAAATVIAEIPSGATFVLAPGEGIVANTPSGATQQLWNFSITWLEA